MEPYRTKIIYDGIVVGYRHYIDNKFIGYTWIKANYDLYEMFIGRRKLC